MDAGGRQRGAVTTYSKMVDLATRMGSSQGLDPMPTQGAAVESSDLHSRLAIARHASVLGADREVLEGDLSSIVRDKLLQEGLVPLDKLLLGEGAQRS